MKIKTILAVATASIVLGAVTSFGATFTDIQGIHQAYETAINEFTIKGVVSGYPDETFRPSNTITRAEVAKIIVTAFDLKLKEGSLLTPLSDIQNTWANEYISIAVSNGAITGYEDGTFRPNNTITYGELCAMLTRLVGADVKEGSNLKAWWAPYQESAYEAGIFKDVTNGDVGDGENKVRRDNMVLMVWNATKYEKPQNSSDTKENQDTKTNSNEKEVSDFDTNKIYFGLVDTKQFVRGKGYIEVDNFNAEPSSLTVTNDNFEPEDESVLFYKVRQSRSINILKELKTSEVKDAYVIEKLDDEEPGQFKIKNQSGMFDINEDEYEFGENVVKLGKCTYFTIYVKKDKYDKLSFTGGEETERFSLVFEEGDRIVVVPDKKVFILIKGLAPDVEL